jgi:hypothetical protein
MAYLLISPSSFHYLIWKRMAGQHRSLFDWTMLSNRWSHRGSVYRETPTPCNLAHQFTSLEMIQRWIDARGG